MLSAPSLSLPLSSVNQKSLRLLLHSHKERSRRNLCFQPHHCHYHSHLSIKKASDYYYIVTKRGVGGACAFSPITVPTTLICQSNRASDYDYIVTERGVGGAHHCHYHSHLSIKASDYYYIVTKRGVGGACALCPITVTTTLICQSKHQIMTS